MMSLEENQLNIYYQATHDSLTGLLNREGLSECLDDFIENYPGRFALLLIDLDDLKKINDSEGHSGGDELLVGASRVLEEVTRHENKRQNKNRKSDVVARGREARIGGDEFVLLLPDVETEGALQTVWKRLDQNLSAANINASIGAGIHKTGMTGSDLLTLADVAMYEDKERRKIERYSPEQREVIEHIASIAVMHDVDLRDIPAVWSALKKDF
jgi:diguanylate cyclase (GGDEF)-like protein